MSALTNSAEFVRHADNEIVVTLDEALPGDATIEFVVGVDPISTPTLTIEEADITVSGVTVTIPFTPTQTGTTLSSASYVGALWRTDDGSTVPLSAGRIVMVGFPYPR